MAPVSGGVIVALAAVAVGTATHPNMLTGALMRDFRAGRDPVNVIVTDPPVPIRQRDAQAPPGWAAVTDRALSDDLTGRYATAEQSRDALAGVL